MTRARALKQTIRARAAKTGERYTAARRHVLKDLATAPASAPPPASPPVPSRAGASLTKGAVTDAKTREKTGHGLDHWFAALDTFGGVAQGHTALARHLHDDHGVSGWYAQGITVAYERARGARALNQRTSGDYEVSVSKVVAAETPAVVKAFSDGRKRKAWLALADQALANALAAALTANTSKGFVVRPDGQARFRYKRGPTTVQVYVWPKAGGKSSVVVTETKLPDAATLEARREEWRTALASLAGVLDA